MKNGFCIKDNFLTKELASFLSKGLIESDGHVARNRRKDGYVQWHCSFANKNPRILEGFIEAMKLTGYEFNRSKHRAQINRRDDVIEIIKFLGLEKKFIDNVAEG